MADRKEYYAKWFQKNRDKEIRKALIRRQLLKLAVGARKFKEMERERNKKSLAALKLKLGKAGYLEYCRKANRRHREKIKSVQS